MGEMTFSWLKNSHATPTLSAWAESCLPLGTCTQATWAFCLTAILRLTGTDCVACERQLYLLGKQMCAKPWRWWTLIISTLCHLTTHRAIEKAVWSFFCYFCPCAACTLAAQWGNKDKENHTSCERMMWTLKNTHGHPEVWTHRRRQMLHAHKWARSPQHSLSQYLFPCENACPLLAFWKMERRTLQPDAYDPPPVLRSNLLSPGIIYGIHIQTRCRQFGKLPPQANLFCN